MKRNLGNCCLFICLQVSQALQIPTKDDSFPRDPSLGSLRRSNSSPSLLSGSSDTLSPRESGSDTAQFSWHEQKAEQLKQDYKSSDSDGGDRSDDNVACKVDTSKLAESSGVHPDSVTNTKQVKFTADLMSESQLDNVIEHKEFNKETKSENVIKIKDDHLSGKVVSEPKDIDHQTDGKAAEYHSMLSKQLSPSPASSEASSTQDEVTELPNVKRLRGHTISVVTPASKLIKSMPVSQGSSSTESTRVGVSPSFVFLQLYHSGALNAGNDLPLLVPSNEVKSEMNFTSSVKINT